MGWTHADPGQVVDLCMQCLFGLDHTALCRLYNNQAFDLIYNLSWQTVCRLRGRVLPVTARGS